MSTPVSATITAYADYAFDDDLLFIDLAEDAWDHPVQHVWTFLVYDVQYDRFKTAVSRIPGAQEVFDQLVRATYDPAVDPTTHPKEPISPMDMPDGFPY